MAWGPVTKDLEKGYEGVTRRVKDLGTTHRGEDVLATWHLSLGIIKYHHNTFPFVFSKEKAGFFSSQGSTESVSHPDNR